MAEPSESSSAWGTAIIASLTALLSALGGWLLSYRKQQSDDARNSEDKAVEHYKGLADRLEARVKELEKTNEECMEKHNESAKQVGKLEAKVEALTERINEFKERLRGEGRGSI